MPDKLFKIAEFNRKFSQYLPTYFNDITIYQSEGLEKHIAKRHPECLCYLSLIPYIINNPDYIGINPNETVASFELVKVLSDNVQIGIKLDVKNNYLYVATLHTITNGKLQHGIENGRLKKFDK